MSIKQIKTELEELNKKDVYSLILFALYKATEIPEYSTLSQLSYLLDKESLLKLCEFYGGLTIRVPTIDELEEVLTALMVYQKVQLEHQDFEQIVKNLNLSKKQREKVVFLYTTVYNVLTNYTFTTGGG